eukprot:g772.t1
MEQTEVTEPSSEIRRELAEVAAIAAGAAMQHGLGKDVINIDEMQLLRRDTIGKEVADIAIQKRLVHSEDIEQIPLTVINEVAILAASKAIQKGLSELQAISEDKMEEIRTVAIKAAEAAIQHGYAHDRPDSQSLRTLSDISKSAAEAALRKSRDASVDEELSENYLRAAREAAQFAIDHKLIDRPDPPYELVSEVARLAAGAAIQRGLGAELANERSIDERKEFLADVARNAAGFAIRKGLGAEVVPNRRMGYELAVLAASAAIRRQEQAQDFQMRVDPQQMAQVAWQAAREAVRLGYGHDESDVMEMPSTPPVADMITKD